MKKLFTREILIGLILIISLAILFIGIDFLKGVNVFKPANRYYASFTDVSGLEEASPVTLNGMKIGQVTGIRYEYDNPGHVEVEVTLDEAVDVTRGSQLEISVGMLGTSSLLLKMAPGTEFCESGDKLEGTHGTGLMTELSTSVMPQAVEMLTKLNRVLASVDTLVASPALKNTVNRLDAISANVDALTAQLAVVSAKVGPVVDNAGSLTANLDSISADLKVLSAELKALPLKETMDGVQATTDNLAAITTQLNGKESTLGLLLNDDGLYNHIDSTIRSLDSVLIDLRANPKKYVNFKLF